MPYGQGQNHSQGEQYLNGSALQPGYGHSRALPDETASSKDKESVQETQEKYEKADAFEKEEALEEYKGV